MKRNSKNTVPPALIKMVLKLFAENTGQLSITGDMEEEFNQMQNYCGKWKAKFWYLRETIIFIITSLFNSFIWGVIMIKNYLKIAIRIIKNQKAFSLINIFGLAIGIAASLIIFIYVSMELSYDTFHKDYNSIQRVLLVDKNLGITNNNAAVLWGSLAPALKKDIADVEEYSRITLTPPQIINLDNKIYTIDDLLLVDPGFLKMFNFQILEGEKETALNTPNSLLLTPTLAKRIFGNVNPIGKTLSTGNNVYTIKGIIQDCPQNSHFQYGAVGSLVVNDTTSTLYQRLNTWGLISIPTYIKLKSEQDEKTIDKRMIEVIRRNGIRDNFAVTHQKLGDVHLKSNAVVFDGVNLEKGDIKFIYLLSAVALCTILIAAFNFMNLSTARSASRAREVGLRKVSGAKRMQLIRQFLSESFIITFISLALAIILVFTVGFYLSDIYNLQLDMSILFDFNTLALLLGIVIFIGIVAGFYPAVVISSFNPISVLRGAFKNSKHGSILRQTVVIIQFAASIAMIISSGIVYQQMNYIKNKDIGYNREQVAYFNVTRAMAQNIETFIERLKQSDAVKEVSRSSSVIGQTMGRTGINPEGVEGENGAIFSTIALDDKAVQIFELKVTKGRFFSREFSSDSNAVVLNESAVKNLGWENPIGKKFNNGSLEVIGVIKDFHFTTLRNPIEPVIVTFNRNQGRVVSVKLSSGKIEQGIEYLTSKWKEFYPSIPVSFNFLDDDFNATYSNEENFGSLTRGFTFLAIFIACLGLFGLTTHTVQQKVKEVGVRKVLGATSFNLVYNISKRFIILVLVANIIAWPASYYLMKGWLEEFAYRVDIQIPIFLISTISALLIAVITVSIQAFKAANADPVKSLRIE